MKEISRSVSFNPFRRRRRCQIKSFPQNPPTIDLGKTHKKIHEKAVRNLPKVTQCVNPGLITPLLLHLGLCFLTCSDFLQVIRVWIIQSCGRQLGLPSKIEEPFRTETHGNQLTLPPECLLYMYIILWQIQNNPPL